MKKFLGVLGFLSCLLLFGCTSNKVNIQFESNGGSTVDAITSIEDIEDGMPSPVREGYIFVGWFEDAALTIPFEIDPDREQWEFTLYAKWLSLTITVIVEHYQEAVDGTFVLYESETNPPDINFASMNLDISEVAKNYPGFTVDSNLITTDSTTTQGTVLIKFYYTRNLYTIIIDEAGGVETPDITVKYGHPVTSVTLTKEGFTFNGFTPALPETMPIDGLTVVANWTPLPEVVVSFEENGGVAITDITTYQGAKITAPIATRVGYEFAGWYTNTDLTTGFDSNQIISASLTLYAKWTPAIVNYKVEYYYESLTGTYEFNSFVTLQALTESTVSASTIPSPQFTLNASHSSSVSSGTVLPDGSLVLKLYADRNEYTISFESNASLSIASIVAPYNQVISAPTNPIRPNYNFVGWYSNIELTQPYSFNNMPGNNITLYASWIGVDTHLYFNSMGGSEVSSYIAPYNSNLAIPSDPIYEGYQFDGWYTEPFGGTLFDAWIMPLGNITIYAHWSPKLYHIEYDSNGGTDVLASNHLFNEAVTKPVNPTKTNYVFNGWFTDIALTIPFDFTTMPAQDLILYAKWISETESKYLENIIKNDEGTFVETTGIVYAIQKNGYTGFYILDNTSYLFILADASTLNTGDAITISGIIHFWNDVPTLMHTSELTVLSTGNVLPDLSETTMSEALAASHSLEIYSSRVKAKGFIVSENDGYYLLNPSNGLKLYLTDRFYLQAEIDSLVNEYVTAELLYMPDRYLWQFGLINYQIETLTDVEKANFCYDWIIRQIDNTYFSYDDVEFPLAEPFGFGTIELIIDSRNDDYIDPVNLVFLPVTETTSVLMPFRVIINELYYNYEKVITLEPLTYTDIADFTTALEDINYLIHGYVAACIEEYSRYVIIDDSGHIVVNYNGKRLSVGDEIVIYAEKQTYPDFYGIESYDILSLEIMSNENQIDYPAVPLTLAEFSLLDHSDPTIYGRYIEIRGFLQYENKYDHDFWTLSDELDYIEIVPSTYNSYESLYSWMEQEIIMRGFIDIDYEGNVVLNYLGLRQDIQLPEYSDQELIDAIMTSFSYFYGERTFQPYDEFILYPYHPLLGGEITWTFHNGSEQYYDALNQCFIFVDESVEIKIEMIITKNEVTQSYFYITTLNPFDYTSAFDLKQVYDYETVYIKGQVIYRTPNEVFLLDDTGIVRIEVYDADIFAGDLVVIQGTKYSDYLNDSPYVYFYSDEDEKFVMGIISRGNEVTIPYLPMTLEQIANQNLETASIPNRYIEVSGLLYGNTDGYDYFYLTNGSHEISIWPVDEYTYYKLADFIIKNGNHVFATIRGFVLGFDDDENSWTILYTGQDADVSLATLSDAEKAAIVENYLTASYETEYVGGNETFYFPELDPFFSASVAYEAIGENASIVNLSTHVIAIVADETEVTIKVIITLGEVTREFTFTMTIVPEGVVVVPADLVTIASLDSTSPFDTVKIQGKILALGALQDGYVFLIQDTTGMIFVRTDFSQYYYDYSAFGKTLTATGHVNYENGRIQFMTLEYDIDTPYSSVSVTFDQLPSKDIEAFDIYDQTNYGKAVEISGKLIYGDGNLGYQIVNGDQSISLFSAYPSSNDMNKYLGLMVRVKGFFFGQLPSSDLDVLSLLFSSYNYGSGSNMRLYESDDQVLAEIGLENILSRLPKNQLSPYYNYYIPTYIDAIPYATVNYEITEGITYASVSGYYLNTYLPNTDTTITLRVTVTANTGVATAYVTLGIKGYAIGTLEELLTAEPGTLKYAVKGVVIHAEWGFCYVLIDGEIYYLERFLDYPPSVGDTVIISGYKTVIDGYSDFTYEIEVMRIDEYMSDSIVPVYVEVNEFYNYIDMIYPSGLHHQLINVTATLKYDTYLDMFYLEQIFGEQPYRIYIREFMPEESEYNALGFGSDLMDRNIFFALIGEEVTMNLLFNFHTILDTYFVLDFRGIEEDFYFEPANALEALDNVAYRVMLAADNLSLQTGEYILDYLPQYDQIYYCPIEYSLKNSSDEAFIIIDNYGFILPVIENKQITLVALITIYDEVNEVNVIKSVEITINIRPLDLSTIKDVIYGALGQAYYFKGVVEFAYSDFDSWIILNDGVNRIYVDCYGCFSYQGFVFATGDEIEIIGERSTYERNGYVPLVDSIRWVNVLSSGHSVSKTPVVMTVEDMLALDYTNPEVYGYYVEITGTLVFSGNVDYPSFDIHEPERPTKDYNIQLWDDDYLTYDDRFYPLLGNTVTLRGYLIGFEYIYDYFDWIVYVDQVVSTLSND